MNTEVIGKTKEAIGEPMTEYNSISLLNKTN